MYDPAMVIVGGGKAGARGVVGLREHGWTGKIVLVSGEKFAPYDRPPLSKAAITEENEPEPVHLLDEGMISSLKVNWIRGIPATSIDRGGKRVILANGESVAYQKLLLATGAHARRLPIPGAERALTLRDYPDMLALRRELTPGRKVCLIGAGFIGLELAATANKRGCSVSVLEMQPRILMRGVPQSIADVIAARHAAAGVAILTNASIDRIEANSVVLKDGRVVPAELLIKGIGAVPAIKLAEESGLQIENGVACDGHMRSSDPDIYAAGDCCSFPHRVFGNRRMRLEAWRSAQDQAAVATENMLGGNKIYDAIPWFWSDQFELTLQIAGLPLEGTRTVTRQIKDNAFITFHFDNDGVLIGSSGIGPGNLIARDIRLSEILMAKHAKPDPAALTDPTVQIKTLLKA